MSLGEQCRKKVWILQCLQRSTNCNVKELLYWFAALPGVTLNTLLGRKGCLEKMKDYWDVGFYLGANILSNEHKKIMEASEKLYRLSPPIWWDWSWRFSVSQGSISPQRPGLVSMFVWKLSVISQVCGLHHGDVHSVPAVCQTARGEISQTGHCGLLDGAAAADLQAHRLHRSLPSKTTMRTCVFFVFNWIY